MNGRAFTERLSLMRERNASGSSHVRVTNLTRAKLAELAKALPFFDSVRSDDELIYELVVAELARRKS